MHGSKLVIFIQKLFQIGIGIKIMYLYGGMHFTKRSDFFEVKNCTLDSLLVHTPLVVHHCLGLLVQRCMHHNAGEYIRYVFNKKVDYSCRSERILPLIRDPGVHTPFSQRVVRLSSATALFNDHVIYLLCSLTASIEGAGRITTFLLTSGFRNGTENRMREF